MSIPTLRCHKCKYRTQDCGLVEEIDKLTTPEMMRLSDDEYKEEIGNRLKYDSSEMCPYYKEEVK